MVGWMDWLGNAKVWRSQPEGGQSLKQGSPESVQFVLAGRTPLSSANH